MTLGGWIAMILSVGSVTWLLGWSVWRVLRTPGATRHIHAPADIETEDDPTQQP